ncbi:hypothetical protein BDQ12DRAFT_315356 [Crucibulum laeve]|uniref:Uncharacterized protein n=1 Tax=Crucibulum laeve TaxID=68775 RepID=A0A5C3LR62_9AGAR|nr:hypothetical protein BDQ12DRAFT_315356 [Crucibulum laeve]
MAYMIEMARLSIPHVGAAFRKFSIKMSVINQVSGKSSIQVLFLNLMRNIVELAGRVVIRIGGNTQEYTTAVDKFPFYLANNISQLTNVKWFMVKWFMDQFSIIFFNRYFRFAVWSWVMPVGIGNSLASDPGE